MREELRINVKLELGDFLNFQYSYLRKKFLGKFLVWGLILLLLPVFIPLFFGGSISFTSLLHPNASWIFIFFVPLLSLLLTYYASRRSYNNDQQIRKEQEYLFDAYGLHFSNENTQTNLPWDELFKVEESKRSIFIYISLTKSFIVPKRYLSAEDLLFLRQKFNSGIKGKPLRQRSIFPIPVRIALIVVPVCIGLFMGLYKNDSEKYFDQGYEKECRKDYEGAIAEYTKAVQEDPSYAAAYNHRGFARGMLGDYTGQIEDCSKAIAIDSDNGSAYNNMSYAKYNLGDTIGACEDLRKALSLGYHQAEYIIKTRCK